MGDMHSFARSLRRTVDRHGSAVNRTNFSVTVSSFDTDSLAPTTTPSISTHGLTS